MNNNKDESGITPLVDEIDRLRAEVAALVAERDRQCKLMIAAERTLGLMADAHKELEAERDRLRAGLERIDWLLTTFNSHGASACLATVRAVFAGADLADPVQAEAVRAGTWVKP